jgi:hypothetical protein
VIPVVLGGLLLVVGLLVLALLFGARDDSGVGGGTSAIPGARVSDPCAAAFGDAKLAASLRRGNVVLAYTDPADRPALERLRDDLAGAPDPILEQAGQAVVLVERPNLSGVAARSWNRTLDVGSPTDPRLTVLVEHELGRGGPAGAAAC